ncbi:glycosyltransferase [Vibrio sp. ABG19]|uniref:glycosyltransferase n=1 Tax=Vibrio sp. ABG19 TaxID=2817385 RepID=UPI00249EF619|nr:glycosyltransferase [Vibrio sp. ABG19]WGY48437.1 glycosyltransferase [Vibrio sp. ABG19]
MRNNKPNYKIAVAMSVYRGDSLESLELAVNSILEQTYSHFDFFIALDGKVDDQVFSYLKSLDNHNVTVIYDEFNKGLAFRLNQIIDLAVKHGDYDFLARMDADDISNNLRFEKQVDFFLLNNDIDVVGSDVLEFDDLNIDGFYKKMASTHEDISKKIIKRCPFNHPSVMFRMAVFNEGYRYKSELMNTQDYYLWVDLLAAGKKFANINEALLKFRVNESFHSRRGLKKAMNDFKSRVYAFRKLDVMTVSNVVHTINLFLLRIAPTSIKKWAYKTLR